jgi:hypothetical protein
MTTEISYAQSPLPVRRDPVEAHLRGVHRRCGLSFRRFGASRRSAARLEGSPEVPATFARQCRPELADNRLPALPRFRWACEEFSSR